jgi:eukaryotic-like serine/threonine-protein kinase
MQEIRLSGKSWRFDESKPLGAPGGFGAVFSGLDENDGPVAVKRLHLQTQQHAARELEIADFLTGHNHPHVIPIYAAGKDVSSGQHFIVMARANQSLEDLIKSSSSIPEQETLEVVSAIASGLAEIGELVHRDLKPANVLLHNGVWKLADLGLARFVEATTSLHTMKGFLSAQYAAPEQWRGERATKNTDVYALGCIIYALLTGRAPFSGQTQAEYSQQHQFAPPPALHASPRLQRLAFACLAKSPELRPTVESLRTQIERMRTAGTSGSANPLANAAAQVAEKGIQREAEKLERQKVEKDRAAAAAEVVGQFTQMMETLLSLILAEAPNAKLYKPAYVPLSAGSQALRQGVTLGDGSLIFDIPFPNIDLGKLGVDWDVLAGGRIMVHQEPSDGTHGFGRSANLWFGKIGTDESYRWWEVAYIHPRYNPLDVEMPFSLQGGHPHVVHHHIDNLRLGAYQLAYNPKRVDGEYFDDFCARWTNFLAKVALRQLSPPRALPEETIKPEFMIRF